MRIEAIVEGCGRFTAANLVPLLNAVLVVAVSVVLGALRLRRLYHPAG